MGNETLASRIFVTALAAASACAAPNAQVKKASGGEPEAKETVTLTKEDLARLRAAAELEKEFKVLRERMERLERDVVSGRTRILPSTVESMDLERLVLLQNRIMDNVFPLRQGPSSYDYFHCDYIREKIASAVNLTGGRSHGTPQTPCTNCPEIFRLEPDDGTIAEWHVFGPPDHLRRGFHIWVGHTIPDGTKDGMPNTEIEHLEIEGRCRGRTMADNAYPNRPVK